LLVAGADAADVSPENKQKARDAYERGAEASARGDHAAAARELALADEIAPNPVALEAALEASIDADDAARGMELAARAEARGEPGRVAELARKARARFSGRVGRVKILCAGCTATLDGEPIPTEKERFVLVGRHVAAVERGEAGREGRTIEVGPGALTLVDGWTTKEKPAASSISPAWFAAGAVLTAVAAGVTVGSAVDTKRRHDSFVAANCTLPAAPPACTGLADDGLAAQTRTNVSIGVSAALGVGTAVLGVFTFGKTNQSAGPASGFSVEPRDKGAFARLVLVLP
jgi:hypothetical protein